LFYVLRAVLDQAWKSTRSRLVESRPSVGSADYAEKVRCHWLVVMGSYEKVTDPTDYTREAGEDRGSS
jgi:hypothetical protein